MKHTLEFMTSALYADSQAIVKNIIFTVAWLQLLDTSMDYYILFEGTDHFENFFSHVRTQDHACNFKFNNYPIKSVLGQRLMPSFSAILTLTMVTSATTTT